MSVMVKKKKEMCFAYLHFIMWYLQVNLSTLLINLKKVYISLLNFTKKDIYFDVTLDDIYGYFSTFMAIFSTIFYKRHFIQTSELNGLVCLHSSYLYHKMLSCFSLQPCNSENIQFFISRISIKELFKLSN